MERFRPLTACLAIACLSFLLYGCGKGGGGSEPTNMAVFASAPADLKEKWQLANRCAEDKDYLGAVTNLTVLFSRAHALTPEQSNTLQQVWVDLGNRAFMAAEEGDKRAVQAVMTMKTSPFGKGPGQR